MSECVCVCVCVCARSRASELWYNKDFVCVFVSLSLYVCVSWYNQDFVFLRSLSVYVSLARSLSVFMYAHVGAFWYQKKIQLRLFGCVSGMDGWREGE